MSTHGYLTLGIYTLAVITATWASTYIHLTWDRDQWRSRFYNSEKLRRMDKSHIRILEYNLNVHRRIDEEL